MSKLFDLSLQEVFVVTSIILNFFFLFILYISQELVGLSLEKKCISIEI